jgi:hypothetical protein
MNTVAIDQGTAIVVAGAISLGAALVVSFIGALGAFLIARYQANRKERVRWKDRKRELYAEYLSGLVAALDAIAPEGPKFAGAASGERRPLLEVFQELLLLTSSEGTDIVKAAYLGLGAARAAARVTPPDEAAHQATFVAADTRIDAFLNWARRDLGAAALPPAYWQSARPD